MLIKSSDCRQMFDFRIRELKSVFPSGGSVYDYFLTSDKHEFVSWEEKLPTLALKVIDKEVKDSYNYNNILIPTPDTFRLEVFINNLIKNKERCMIMGDG